MRAKELATKTELTAADKKYLIAKAKKLGIEVPSEKDCDNCYNDLALLIYNAAKENDEAKYILNDGVDIILGINGVRINAATLTDELAERLIAAGHTRFFKKMP